MVLKYLGLGKGLEFNLVAILRETFFSVVIDETTDIQTKSELAIVVSYWCTSSYSIVVDLIGFVECVDASGLKKAIFDLLESHNIPQNR